MLFLSIIVLLLNNLFLDFGFCIFIESKLIFFGIFNIILVNEWFVENDNRRFKISGLSFII